MAHQLGASGSTIYSNPELFSELFWDGIDHIEIGEFLKREDFEKFLKLCQEKQTTFGVHSPLLRSGSKYDLIEKIKYDTEDAWRQLAAEAEELSALGAKYLLVHFPFFTEEGCLKANDLIEEGLKKLSEIQERYGIDFVCEPKLAPNRSPVGINYLHDFPVEIWSKYHIKMCIDIGDYLIAAENQVMAYLVKWKPFIKVVHLHNVLYEEEGYLWIPVHPSQEETGNYQLEKIIRWLAEAEDVFFVFEHTPESKPSKAFVQEGYNWVRSLVK